MSTPCTTPVLSLYWNLGTGTTSGGSSGSSGNAGGGAAEPCSNPPACSKCSFVQLAGNPGCYIQVWCTVPSGTPCPS
jgi:hypothetical protein